MTKIEEIKYVDWQYKLNKIGDVAEGVDDINQCISTIILTRKGSVPHRPTFGSEVYKYIDYPITIASPHIIREVTDSITLWENRIKLNSVKVELQNEKINIKIEWTLNNSNTKGAISIIL